MVHWLNAVISFTGIEKKKKRYCVGPTKMDFKSMWTCPLDSDHSQSCLYMDQLDFEQFTC